MQSIRIGAKINRSQPFDFVIDDFGFVESVRLAFRSRSIWHDKLMTRVEAFSCKSLGGRVTKKNTSFLRRGIGHAIAAKNISV